ncbi:hypothetical protein [Metabacillus litoralis]|nr:hypothetical protein [Metabacillus litoralis]
MKDNKIKFLEDKKIGQIITCSKVIEYNVSDCTENLYAVVTPVKNSECRI